MKKLVVINSKTGEVRSVESYVRETSEVWIVGWIDAGDKQKEEQGESPKPYVKRALHNIFQRIDRVEGNYRDIEKRLEVQERSSYYLGKEIARIMEILNNHLTNYNALTVTISQTLQKLDGKLAGYERFAKDTDLEGTKNYILHEQDKLLHEFMTIKNGLKELHDKKKWVEVTTPKKPEPEKKKDSKKQETRGRPSKKS